MFHRLFSKIGPSRSARLSARAKSHPQTDGAPDSNLDHNSLRILILTSEAPPVVSGISKTVELLRRGLSAQGHRVNVLSREDYPRYMRNEIRISAFALFWPRMRRQLRNYDVVNVHGPVPTMSEIFLVLVRCLHHSHRPAVVYTHHSDLSIRSLERWCSIYNRLNKALSRLADVVIVSSYDYRAKIGHDDGPAVSVIPWAVDVGSTDRPDEGVRSRGQLDAKQLKVLFVGQLRGYKGVDVLLDAVTQEPRVQLTLVGDGPMRAQLTDRVAQFAIEDRVALRGRISDRDLWRAYLAHDVIALPSITTAEAYGLVLMEGMSAGCVPLASDLPGVREVAARSGLVVPPGDAQALQRALTRLLDDPDLLARLSTASLEYAKSLSVEVMADSYAQAMHTAIAGNMERRAGAAIPSGWEHPERLLEQLSNEFDVDRLSVSLVSRRTELTKAHVWRHGDHGLRTDAPVARYVARTNRPVLIVPDRPIAGELRPLLRRPELSSAILVPIRRTRHTVSVIGLSTDLGERPPLGPVQLETALKVLASAPRYRRSA
jgi:glycosyltransferase involved in cell wall biosynthesis